MTDRAWFDAAKGDIPQWAASMPKDADGTTIDWDWVRSLDLAHGVGTIPESTPQSIHDALKADYATRERLESIIAQCNSAFMTDFDRFIGSYRLPRALAYANRRLNDNINTLLHLGEQQHLWVVSRERRGRTTVAVLRPYSGSRPSNDDQGMLNLSGETGDASAGNTAAENSDVKFPTTVALDVQGDCCGELDIAVFGSSVSGRCVTGFTAQIQHALVIVRWAAAGVRPEHGNGSPPPPFATDHP